MHVIIELSNIFYKDGTIRILWAIGNILSKQDASSPSHITVTFHSIPSSPHKCT